MRDGETTIHCTLQSTKNFVSSSSSGKTCIKVACESTRLSIHTFHIVFITSHFNLAFIDLIKAKFIQKLWEREKKKKAHLKVWPFTDKIKNHHQFKTQICSRISMLSTNFFIKIMYSILVTKLIIAATVSMPVTFQLLVPTDMPGNSKLIHMLIWKMDKWGLHVWTLKGTFLTFFFLTPSLQQTEVLRFKVGCWAWNWVLSYFSLWFDSHKRPSNLYGKEEKLVFSPQVSILTHQLSGLSVSKPT